MTKKARHFPFYVTRESGSTTGCGHQHDTRGQARNCAVGLSHRSVASTKFLIIKVSVRGGNLRETILGTLQNGVWSE